MRDLAAPPDCARACTVADECLSLSVSRFRLGLVTSASTGACTVPFAVVRRLRRSAEMAAGADVSDEVDASGAGAVSTRTEFGRDLSGWCGDGGTDRKELDDDCFDTGAGSSAAAANSSSVSHTFMAVLRLSGLAGHPRLGVRCCGRGTRQESCGELKRRCEEGDHLRTFAPR